MATTITLPPKPLRLRLGAGIRFGDDELSALCAANPELPGLTLELGRVWDPLQ
jgi:hypothetical protein